MIFCSTSTPPAADEASRHEALGHLSARHASDEPRADQQGGRHPLRTDGRGSGLRRHRLHRPSGAVAQVAAGWWARRARPVRGPGVRCCGHRAHPADPQHRRAAVPQPVPGGQGGRHHRCAVRRTLRAGYGDRLPAQRVPRSRRRVRRPERAVRRGGRGAARSVVHGLVRPRRSHLHRHGTDRESQADQGAALDRRQQRAVTSAGRPLRRRLEPVPGAGDVGEDRPDSRARDNRRPRSHARRAVAARRRGRARPGVHRRGLPCRRRRFAGRRDVRCRRPPGRARRARCAGDDLERRRHPGRLPRSTPSRRSSATARQSSVPAPADTSFFRGTDDTPCRPRTKEPEVGRRDQGGPRT